MKTTEYPINTTSLSKGDYLSQETIEAVTKLHAGTAKYAFKLLSIKGYIAKQLAKRGLYVTCAIRKNGIAILTDSEAATYNVNFAHSGARRIRRARLRHSVVDLSKLTEAERSEWDKNAKRLAVMSEGVKPVRLVVKAHKKIE